MTDELERLKTALADTYAVESELGAGGMATVYLAKDLKHDRLVAVKVLRPELAASLGTERFLREIQVTAKLTHPHILPLYDSGDADGFLYYVMPYVEGESLADMIHREQQLRSTTRYGSPARPRARSRTPTATDWSTATSSRRTSCCRAGTRSWPTSASRAR